MIICTVRLLKDILLRRHYSSLSHDIAEVVTFKGAFPGPTLLVDLITRAGSQHLKSAKLNIACFCL
jgi:hypothetical protein